MHLADRRFRYFNTEMDKEAKGIINFDFTKAELKTIDDKTFM